MSAERNTREAVEAEHHYLLFEDCLYLAEQFGQSVDWGIERYKSLMGLAVAQVVEPPEATA